MSKQIKLRGSKLEDISLSENSFGVPACEALEIALGACQNIKIADLSGIFNNRKKEEIPNCIKHLSFGLSSSRLLYLDLSDNALGPEPAESLAPLLRINSELQVFKLNNNGLGPQGAVTIYDSIMQGGCRLQIL